MLHQNGRLPERSVGCSVSVFGGLARQMTARWSRLSWRVSHYRVDARWLEHAYAVPFRAPLTIRGEDVFPDSQEYAALAPPLKRERPLVAANRPHCSPSLESDRSVACDECAMRRPRPGDAGGPPTRAAARRQVPATLATGLGAEAALLTLAEALDTHARFRPGDVSILGARSLNLGSLGASYYGRIALNMSVIDACRAMGEVILQLSIRAGLAGAGFGRICSGLASMPRLIYDGPVSGMRARFAGALIDSCAPFRNHFARRPACVRDDCTHLRAAGRSVHGPGICE